MPSFLLGYIAGFLCIYGLPEGFYGLYWVGEFTRLMRSMIPSIEGYWSKSNFPEVSAFYISIQPILFLPILLQMMINKDICFGKRGFQGVFLHIQKKRFPSAVAVIGFALFLFMAFIFYAQPGYQYGIMPVNEEKWALAIFGPVVGFFAVYLMLALAWSYVLLFVKTLRG